MILNTQQQQALEGIKSWFEQVEKLERSILKVKDRFSLLTGYPGTGKSVLVAQLVRDLYKKQKRVLIATPTHFAKNVLVEFLRQEGVKNSVRTIYSVLGLKPEINDVGEEIFIQDPQSSALDFSEYDLLIIDEASMINRELWAILTTTSTLPPCFFVGDSLQLKPVKSPAKSPVFSRVQTRFELTQVMRYQGAIANYIAAIRESYYYVSPTLYADQVELVYCEKQEWFLRISEVLETTQTCRALAYTNKSVDMLNTILRREKLRRKEGLSIAPNTLEKITGIKTAPVSTIAKVFNWEDLTDEYCEREKLITKEPILSWNSQYRAEEIVCHNGTEVNIARVEKQNICDLGAYKLDIWWFSTDELELKISNDVYWDDENSHLQLRQLPVQEATIWVLASTEKVRFAQKLKELKDLALKYPSQSRERKNHFREYYRLKKLFTSVQHVYASTVHKSQGATFDVIFLYNDILACRDIETQKELNYVGCSRARKQLVICK